MTWMPVRTFCFPLDLDPLSTDEFSISVHAKKDKIMLEEEQTDDSRYSSEMNSSDEEAFMNPKGS